MSRPLYTGLAWLPHAPEDFTLRCRALLDSADPLGTRIRELAGFALDPNQLTRLAGIIEKARKAGRSLAPLTPFRLGILSNATVDFTAPAMVASAARHGIALECITADYGQVLQDAVSPDSPIHRASPDAVLLAVDYRGLPLRATPGDAAGAQQNLAAAADYLRAVRHGIRSNSRAVCILQTLATPPESLFGNLDRTVPGTLRSLIDAMNRTIAESIPGSGDLLLDVATLAETVGLAEWHGTVEWNLAKLPFSTDLVPFYADHVARVIAALRGKSRRCLVLDLDNTVWGGVIGDDGLDGILVAQGDPVGEAHLTVQRTALGLRERGIVLAVSSKNDDQIARSPFREHPEMLLRENHFAVFQANWNDKATNLRSIASELALGLESFVFLDDNPIERNLVRQMLPEVAVPELPEEPALYARVLAAAGYFEAAVFSADDLKRAAQYEDNARRAELQAQVGDLAGYLASLKMEITFQPFDKTGRARITQLINKSNQFNLTTRRYTEAQVEELESDEDCLTLQVRLSDTFGDNGMISVVVCRPGGAREWHFDTWLMSCRVLSRGVESMVLREVLERARASGIEKLVGTFVPTPRNELVREHYSKLGFTPVETRADGATVWELDVRTASVDPPPMTVHRLS
jgi:FkbH-like protein